MILEKRHQMKYLDCFALFSEALLRQIVLHSDLQECQNKSVIDERLNESCPLILTSIVS